MTTQNIYIYIHQTCMTYKIQLNPLDDVVSMSLEPLFGWFQKIKFHRSNRRDKAYNVGTYIYNICRYMTPQKLQ